MFVSLLTFAFLLFSSVLLVIPFIGVISNNTGSPSAIMLEAQSSGNLNLSCYFSRITPTLDGNISVGEWNDAEHMQFFFTPVSSHPADYIDILYKHNNTHLFIAFDVRCDNTSDSTDEIFIYMDLNQNGTKDLQLTAMQSGANSCRQYPNLDICITAMMEYAAAFGTTPNKPNRDHRSFEVCIAINRTVTYTGQNLTSATALPFGNGRIGIVFAGIGTVLPQYYYGNSTNNVAHTELNSTYYANFALMDKLGPNLICYKAQTNPTIDGTIAASEWDDAEHRTFFFRPTSGHPDDYIDVLYKHNDTHLLIAYDVQGDNTVEFDDLGWIFLDLNNNETEDVFFEVRRADTRNCQQWNYGSSPSIVWGNATGTGTSPQEAIRPHTMIELAISIDRNTNYTGQDLTSGATQIPMGVANNSIGIVFAGRGTMDPEWYYGNDTNILTGLMEPTWNTTATYYANFTLVEDTIDDKLVPEVSLAPSDASYVQGSTGRQVSWILTDIYGGGTYRVLRNGIPISVWTGWVAGDTLTVPVVTSTVGTFNYSIEYVDWVDNGGTDDWVLITITAPPPPIPGFEILFILVGLVTAIGIAFVIKNKHEKSRALLTP